jgi:hypothetical protein
MQLTDLRTDARYLISPQLTAADYPDVDLDRNLNSWYRKLFVQAFKEQGDWEIEGDLIYRDFAVGVTDFEVPSNLIRIFKGEVMYETGGGFVPLKFISVQREQSAVEGNATRVRDDVTQPTAELFGNYIQIRPASEATVVNGIKLWAQLDLVTLDTTNDVPNFAEPAHRFISAGAALDYAIAEEMDKKEVSLKRMLFGDSRVREDDGLQGDVKVIYANRTGARRQQLTAKRGNFK